ACRRSGPRRSMRSCYEPCWGKILEGNRNARVISPFSEAIQGGATRQPHLRNRVTSNRHIGLCGRALLPRLHQSEQHCQQRRPDEQSEEAERNESSEHPQEHESHRRRRTEADQPGPNDVVPDGKTHPPDHNKNGPAVISRAEQPPRRTAPDDDEKDSDLAERNEQREESEQPAIWN